MPSPYYQRRCRQVCRSPTNLLTQHGTSSAGIEEEKKEKVIAMTQWSLSKSSARVSVDQWISGSRDMYDISCEDTIYNKLATRNH